jgi:hypothetical protein
MSTVEQMFHDALVNDSTFNGLIGGRLRYGQLRLGETLPAASYLRVNTKPWILMDQTSGKWQQGGIARFWLTLSFQSKTGGQDGLATAQAAQAALLKLNATRATPAVTAGTSAPNFLVDQYTRVNGKADPPIFEVIQDWKILYQES